MKSINLSQEWEIMKFETHYNKPQIDGSYPKDVVCRRELLLLAQCVLANYQSAKSKKYRNFFGELYLLTMDTYFAR